MPQLVVMKAIHREGQSFLITRLEGILFRDEIVRMEFLQHRADIGSDTEDVEAQGDCMLAGNPKVEETRHMKCRNLLGENVRDEKQAHRRLVPVPRQVQVLLHAVETRIADVDSVEETLERETE